MTLLLTPDHIQALPNPDLVLPVLQAAMNAADPSEAVASALKFSHSGFNAGNKYYSLAGGRKIIAVGAGKASISMLAGLFHAAGKTLAGGIIIAKTESPQDNPLPVSCQVLRGGHPIPTTASIQSTRKLIEFVHHRNPESLIVCLISGGGSALMTYPVEGVSLGDIQALNSLLLNSGADITAINTIRKHLDCVKGGGLARIMAPSEVMTLVLSDVIGNNLEVIASGPTVADSTTFQDALDILTRYGLTGLTPRTVYKVLEKGAAGLLSETLKENDPILERVQNIVVGSNHQSARAACDAANKLGFNSRIITSSLEGLASQAAAFIAATFFAEDNLNRPLCLIAGGETTVHVTGNGLGGRNLELALSAVRPFAGQKNIALVTLATDGEDGPTDAAGAIVTGETLTQGLALGLVPEVFLQNNDSYHYFERINSLVRTGSTGTNVNDLTFLFAF